MATLVLTAVGSAVGGPLGSAIGAFVGQQIDRALIGNGPRREGPRLKELEVQTSSYGTAIPAIFGSMRVAGTVIWASDLIEKKSVTGGSKSQPGTANYSYSANLAVAVSSRPIARVGRIWADGNLLRGAAGDLKFETELRVQNGDEDQPVDPLLASAESSGLAPAYRGLAYVVFEGLQLAEFGNRIPSLTFEVFEREEPVPLHAILNAVSGQVISGSTPEMLAGFAVQGRDVRASVEPLLETFPVSLLQTGDGLVVQSWFDTTQASSLGSAAAKLNGKAIEQPKSMRSSQSSEANAISLRYYDKDRDFQAGHQRQGSHQIGNREVQFELPACLSAHQALRLSKLNWLQQFKAKSKSVAVTAYSDAPPSSGANLAGENKKITEIEYLRGCVRISSQDWLTSEMNSSVVTDPGRDLTAPDHPVGQTLIQLIDLPAVKAPLHTEPVIGVVAAGTGEGWRKASLAFRDGQALTEIGRTAPAGVIGSTLSVLPAHTALLVDTSSSLIVRVSHQGMDLPAGTGNPLSPNAPLMHISGELFKYGMCEQIGAIDFRLSNLARGCFGTERKIRSHAVNSTICLIAKESLVEFSALGLAIDGTATFEAFGVGDDSPVAATMADLGLAIRPLPPCHLRTTVDAAQNVSISWIRRSRFDTGWRDYADLPLDELQLLFDLEIVHGIVSIANFQVAAEHLEIPAEVVSGWGLPQGSSLSVSVRQRGASALSLQATTVFIQP